MVELATAPLRAKLAGLQRAAGLQHRQVTVLFADVVGSTAMAQGLEAEEALAVLDETMRRMADIVQAHQGRVLRFTGDGVKAAFGIDEAREDDAQRAVSAGLAILAAGRAQAEALLRTQGVADFAVRVGLHTGDVALGAGIDADNTAMGAAVNIAARMEQTAPPGALRISHDTWSLVRGLFDVQAQPPLLAKGIDLPMQTYLVSAALDRSVASLERGLQGLNTPMVGRDAELQRLLHAVGQARQTRQLQALTLLGDAGLGKSRLLRELAAALRAGPAACRVITLRSQPDGELRPWGLLRTLLATQFSVADTDSAETARRKVIEGLSPWFDERGQRQAQLIGQLSGLDFGDSPDLSGLSPRSLRDQALAAFLAFLQALAAKGGSLPVLIVEDLHWADDGSLDLLQHLLAHAAELPLALLMSARPALLKRRPDWGVPSAVMQLSRLAPAQSDALTQALLQHLDVVPARLTTLIADQAEGNPYYIEELVRRLVDDGVIAVDNTAAVQRWTLQADRLQNLRLPATLVGLLQARLDALPVGERLAARQASVIGPVFWDDALLALDPNAPQALPALQRAAFVRARDTSNFEDTAERQFDHHLLHQVTYETLLKSERRQGHGVAARWLAERTKGRSAEFLAMTGEHAERAGDSALAADCFDQAAVQARSRYANSAAVSWLRRAVTLLGDTDPGRRFDLLYRLQVIADTVGDRQMQDAAHAELTALLVRHSDDARQARLLFSLALLSDRRSDTAASERYSLQAFEVAERCGAASTAAGAQGNLAWLHVARKDYPAAARHLELGLQWASKIEDRKQCADREAQLLTVSGMVSMLRCRFDEARVALTAVLARGQELALPRLQLGALNNLALVESSLGRWEASAAWGQRMGELAQAVGAQPDCAEALMRQALAAQVSGDLATALRGYEQSLVIFRATGDRRTEAVALRHLGALHLEQGDASTAMAWCQQAQALHPDLVEVIEANQVQSSLALCQARIGQLDAARSAVNTLLGRVSMELAEHPAHETIALRWTCQQVLDTLGDARAAPVLEQLFTDVQARATELTDAADRGRLIQALPVFRAIVAAHAQRGWPKAAS